jgi:hypothetical protein
MSFANTFITLSDVDITSLSAGKFLRVRPSGNVEIAQFDITTDTLTDIETSGAYTPSTGETLVYTADNKWRPATLDVYSAGNGLNKSGLVLNVTAGTGGGLVSNSSGVFIADVTDAANVAGTHGNATFVPSITVGRDGRITGVTPTEITVTAASSLTADYINSIAGTSGQITVTGGTGNKANATLNLVATGVTAGVYGNTTHAPRITVDTYGRISSVDTVAVSGSGGSGNASLGFANIIISGQTTVSAEKLEDDLTITQGTGMAITTLANTDTISFGINPSTAAAAMDIADFNDVDTTGITNGQVLIWNSSTSKFEAGDQTGSGGGSNVQLTSFSVTTASPSGNGSLSYNNAGVFTFTPANVSSGGINTAGVDAHLNTSGASSGQVLTWNGSDYAWTAKTADTDTQDLSISGNVISLTNGGTVDLTSALASAGGGTDSQDLTISGNVISLTGQSGNVDLTSALGAVAGTYTNASVDSHLNQSNPTAGYVLSWNGSDYAWVADNDAQNLTWNAGSTTLGVSNGNTVNLSALEQTLSISGNVITISGNDDTVDLTTALSVYQRSDAGATANTNMKAYVDAQITLIKGGANVNLDSLAEVANALNNSNTQLSTVAFTGNHSDIQNRPAISLSGSDFTFDGTTLDLSGLGATGPQGPQGVAGSTGATGNGITTATVNGSGNLLLTYSNTSTQDLGNIKGVTGPTGATGAQGPAGNVLVSTGNAAPSGASEGQMWYATDDGHTYIYHDSVWVQANPGQDPQTLSINNSSNVITISGSSSTIDLTTVLQKMRDTDTDAQDLTISGNVISLTGQSGNVDLTSILGAVNTDAQDLSISGNVISLTGQSGNVDLTATLAPYLKAETDSQDLTLSGNVISLTGQSGNVDLTSLLGSAGGGISNVVEDTTPQLGGDLDVNGKDLITTSNGDIDLNPNGSGVVVFRGNGTRGAGQFKLNCEANSHGITIKGPPHSAGASYTLTLPDDDGSADQVLKTDGSGNLSWVNQSGGGGGGSLTIQDEGSALANAGTTINFVGAGVTATGTGTTKTVTIPGGSGVALVQRFKLNYLSSGNLGSTSDLTSLISSVNIDSASGGDVTVNFDSSINYPPASIMIYGYDYANNVYKLVPLETTMALRQIDGGGSSGSPTLFNGSSNISLKLRLREAETGASRSFGTVTHAWIEFVVYD